MVTVAEYKAFAVSKQVKRPKTLNEGEERLAQQLKSHGITFDREYRFAPPRRWKFDFAIIEHMIAVEIEGGIYSGGRHTRGAGFEADMEKYNAAAMLGWRLLRYTPKQIKTGAPCSEIVKACKL